MKNHFYKFSIILFSLIYFPSLQAEEQNLPLCESSVCTKVFHNKILEKATLVVWKNESDILTSHTFDLDRSAKLVIPNSGQSKYSNNVYSSNSEAPAPPCYAGACSSTLVNSYVTPTEIVTVTITFVYFNGILLDIHTTSVRTKKPPVTIEN